MIFKWECDGASDQSRYKLNFNDSLRNDSSVFICSFVPIKIYSIENSEVVLWENSFPSSTRFCRPIEFKFVKEEETEVKTIVERINEQIFSLTPSISEEGISMKHTLLFTMIDDKIGNIMTNTKSSMKFYLCDASPKEMNDLNAVKKKLWKINNFCSDFLRYIAGFVVSNVYYIFRIELISNVRRETRITNKKLSKEKGRKKAVFW